MQKTNNGKPNILFIMSDQHRYDYFGAAGADFMNTPNLDRLAQRGVRFSNCCTNSPLCTPARLSLATGLLPHRVGLRNPDFLPLSTPTYYQHVRDHGYRVGCVGKLDLAKADGYNGRYGDRPCAYSWGFTHPEECEGKMHAGRSATPLGPYTWYLENKGLLQAFHEDYQEREKKGWIKGASHDSVLPTEDFEDVYIGRRAAEWLRNVPDDFPWHYFVSFVGPHDPFDPPTEYADLYRDADVPAPIPPNDQDKPDWIDGKKQGCEAEEIRTARRQYCASTQAIDEQIGAMLDALEERGMLENTYIIYSSDHGEMLGDHGLFTKSVPYEASMRVPLLISGPGIEKERTSEALVELMDLNPTISDLAGLPRQREMDAQSLLPVLEGQTDTHRSGCVSALTNFRCIRTAEHKFVESYNDKTELYDLRNDPDEQVNVIDDHPEAAGQLRRQLNERWNQGAWNR